MKEKLYLTALFVFVFASLFSQAPIVLTKNKGYGAMSKFLPYDQNVTIQISGYNPFATKLNGSGKDIDLSYSIPSVFSSTVGKITDVAPAAAPASPNPPAGMGAIRGGNPKDKLTAENEALKNQVKNLTDASSCENIFKQNYNAFVDDLQIIYGLYLIENYIKQTISNPEMTENVATAAIRDYIRSVSPTNNPLNDINQSLADLNKNYSALKLCYDKLSKTLTFDSGKAKIEVIGLDNNFKASSNTAYLKVDRKKYFFEEYTYATQKFNQLNTDTIWNLIRMKVASGMTLFAQVQDPESWLLSYVVGEISDAKEIKLIVTDKSDKVIKDYGAYTIHTYGQLKVDVSAGYLVSFRGDENYASVPDGDGKTVGVSRQQSDAITQNVGFLVHAYPQKKGNICFGPSAGFSVPVNSDLNFYLGGSVLFTSHNRLVITCGVAYTRLKVLDTGNLTAGTKGRTFDFVSPTNTELKYNSIYRFAPFIGLSYNFASLKK